MKNILYILLFVSTIINGQEIESVFSESVCECFTKNEEQTKKNFNMKILETCMNFAVEDNKEKFNELVLKNIDTTNLDTGYVQEYGYQLGQKMFTDIQIRLVNNCDAYNNFASHLISQMLKNIGKDSSQKKIDSISNLIDDNPKNINLVWQRGAHKIGLGKLKSAQADLKTCLEIDDTHAPALFFLACSYDMEGKSKKAAEIFEKILDQNRDFGSLGDFTKIYLAVLKRKLIEEN